MQKSRTENNLRQHLLSNTQQNPTQPGHQVTVIQVPWHPPSIQPTLDKPRHTSLPPFAISILCSIFLSLDVFPETSNTTWKHIKQKIMVRHLVKSLKGSWGVGNLLTQATTKHARPKGRERWEMHPQGRSKLRAVRASKKLHFWSPQPRGHRLGSPPLGTGSSWARGGIPAQPGEGCRSCLLPVQCQQGCWAPSVGTAAFHCPSRDGKRKSSGSFEQLPAHGWTQRL